MSKLNQEEREILEAFESGTLKKSKGAAATQKQHKEYAEGIPYQTLVASVLHKYVEGRLRDQDS
jgi:hypothetical protein